MWSEMWKSLLTLAREDEIKQGIEGSLKSEREREVKMQK